MKIPIFHPPSVPLSPSLLCSMPAFLSAGSCLNLASTSPRWRVLVANRKLMGAMKASRRTRRPTNRKTERWRERERERDRERENRGSPTVWLPLLQVIELLSPPPSPCPPLSLSLSLSNSSFPLLLLLWPGAVLIGREAEHTAASGC